MIVMAYCPEPGCRCLDRSGVILYTGDSREEAERTREDAPRGYAVVIEGDADDT